MIKVIGIGEVGNDVLNKMIGQNVCDLEFIEINKDSKILESSKAAKKFVIDEKLAEETDFINFITDSELVFLASSVEGFAVPYIAELSKKLNILTIAVVSKENDNDSVENIKKSVDTIFTVSNGDSDNIIKTINSIAGLITKPGDINIDIDDLKEVMSSKGVAQIVFGSAKGENKAVEAVKTAVNDSDIKTTIAKAKKSIVNICGGENLDMIEVQQATTYVSELVDADAEIIIGTSTNADAKDEVSVTIIAVDFV